MSNSGCGYPLCRVALISSLLGGFVFLFIMTSIMKITGKVFSIGKEELVGEKRTPKITVVVEESGDSQYPNKLAIDFFGEKVDIANDLTIGDEGTFSLNTKVNKSKTGDRVFNAISAWKVDIHSAKTESIHGDLPF